jgi:Ca2+-binding EF-hand superfamily protein
MKLHYRLIAVALATSIAAPCVSFAAKSDRKKKETPVAFSTLDKNSDGSVTLGEYTAAMKGKMGEEGAKSQFAQLDKNSDGKLTSDEYSSSSKPEKKRKKK